MKDLVVSGLAIVGVITVCSYFYKTGKKSGYREGLMHGLKYGGMYGHSED